MRGELRVLVRQRDIAHGRGLLAVAPGQQIDHRLRRDLADSLPAPSTTAKGSLAPTISGAKLAILASAATVPACAAARTARHQALAPTSPWRGSRRG